MKAAFFVLPFVAFLIGVLGTAIGSSFPEIAYANYIGWGIAFFIVAVWVFLDFKNMKNFFMRKGSKFGAGSGAVFIAGILVAIGLAVLSNRPRFNKSFDVTRSSLNTLSEQSFNAIKILNDRDVHVDVEAFFQDENIKNTFKEAIDLYIAAGADLTIKYYDTQQEPTRAIAAKLTSANTAIFKNGTQEARISTFNEEKITNALIKILKQKTKKIYFTKGHGEGLLKGSEPTGYNVVVQQLENEKYSVESISLFESAGVPSDADLVVVAGPEYDIKPAEIDMLEKYLDNGGSVLFMVDAIKPVININALTKKYGFKYGSDLLILSPEDPRAALLGQNNAIVSEFDSFNPVTRDFARQSQVDIIMPFTRSVEPIAKNEKQTKVTSVGNTSEAIVKIKGVHTQADLQDIGEDRIQTGTFPVIVVASRKIDKVNVAKGKDKKAVQSDVTSGLKPGKEIRLVAVGSSQFAKNQGAQTSPIGRSLFSNITSYLLQDDDFISIAPKDAEKTSLSLVSLKSQFVLAGLSYIYPLLFLGFGLVFWLKRRNA